jgi:hypothetical protein
MFKKAVYGITGILTVMALFGGMTGLQFLPFLIFLILGFFNIKLNYKNNVWILILSGIMFFLNFSIGSVIDYVLWALVFIAFLK